MDGALGRKKLGQGGRGQQATRGHLSEESGQDLDGSYPQRIRKGLVTLNSHLEFRGREGGGPSIYGVVTYA